MRWFNFWIFLCIPIFDANCFIVPDEIPTALSVIYSNIPKIKIGSDSRIGWGFRFGDRADAQILLELGPQHYTQPLANQQPFDNPNYPELSSSLDTEDYDIAQDPSENSLAEEVENEKKKEESDDISENKIEEVSDELVIKTEIETMDNLLSKLTEKAENISNIDHSELSDKASKVNNNLMHMLDEKITEEKAKLKNLEVMTKLQFEKNEPLTEKNELKGLISKLKNYMNKTTETEENDTDALTTVEIGTLQQLIKRLGNIENFQKEKREKNDNPDIQVEKNLEKEIETTNEYNDGNIHEISKKEENILEKIEEELKNSIENPTRSSQQNVALVFNHSYTANTKESSKNKIEIMNTHNQILKMVDDILEKTEEKLENLDINSTVKDKHNNEPIQTENIFDDRSYNFEEEKNPDMQVEKNLKKGVETTNENIYKISKEDILKKIEEKLKNSNKNSTRSSQQNVPLEFDHSYIANTIESSKNKKEIMNMHNQILKMVDNILEKTEEKLKNLDINSTVKDKHNSELIQTENIFDDTSNNFELNSWKIGSLKSKAEFTDTEDNILEKIQEKLKNSIENSTRSSQRNVPLEFDHSYIANTKESSKNKIEIMNTHNQILKMVDNILEKTEKKLKNLDMNSTVTDEHDNEFIQTENIFNDTSDNFELNSWKIGSLKPKAEFTEIGNSEKREKIFVEENEAISIEAESAKDRKTNMIMDNKRNEKEEEAKPEITPVILKSEKNNEIQNGTSIGTTTHTAIKSKEMGDLVEKGEKNKDDTIEVAKLNEEVKNGESTTVYADSELEENRSENTSINYINKSFEIVTKHERLNEQETTEMQINEAHIEEKSQQTPTNLSNETLVNTIKNSTLSKTKDLEEKSSSVDINSLTTQTEINGMNSNESSISQHGKDHEKPIILRIIQERNDTSIYEFNTTTIKSELTNISQTGNIVTNQNKNTDDDDILENFVEAGKKEEFTTEEEINEEKYSSKVPENEQSNSSKVHASEAPVNNFDDSTKNDNTKSKGEQDILNVRETNQTFPAMKEYTMEELTKIYLESIKSDEESEKSTSHHNSTKVENESQIMKENMKDLETPQAQIAKYNATKESNVQNTPIEKPEIALVYAINEKDTSSKTPEVEKQTKKFNESTSVSSHKNNNSRQIIPEIISEPNNDFYALNKTAATIMKFVEINKIRNSATKTDKNIISEVSENYDSNKIYSDTIKPQRNKQYKKQMENSLEMSRNEEKIEGQVHTNSTNEALDNIINRIKILDGTINELKIKLNEQLKHWNENSESSQILFSKNLKILKILKEEKEKKITEITKKEWKTADNIDIILEGPYKGVKMKSFKMLSLLWNKNYTNDRSKEIINKESKTSQEGKLENIITDINSTKGGDEKIFNSSSVNMVNYEISTTENKTDIEYLHNSQTNTEGTERNAENESRTKILHPINNKQSNMKLNQDGIEAMNKKKENTTNLIIQKNQKFNISNESNITRKFAKTDNENMKLNTHNGSVDEEYMMTMIAMNRAQERNRENSTRQLAAEKKTKSYMKSQQDNYIDEEYKNTMFVMNTAIKGQNMVNNTLKVIKSTIKGIDEGKTDLTELLVPRNVYSNKKNNGEESGKPLNEGMKFNSSNKVVDDEYKMTMMAMNSAHGYYQNNFLKKPALYQKSVAEERKRGILQPTIEIKKGSKYPTRIPSASSYTITSLQRKESPKTIGGRMMAYISRILQGANKKIQVNNRRLK